MPGDSQVFNQELKAFMAAIGKQESGGRYHILGPQTKYGRPRGKYQILDSNWPSWSKAAGIPGADWRDPAAQERVASYMFTRYYEQYGGRWDAVAVAWFAGGGRAKKYLANPRSVTSMQDVLGTSVGRYVEKAMAQMQRNLGRDPMQSGFQDFSADAYERWNEKEEQQPTTEEAARGVMDIFNSIFSRDPNATETTLNVAKSDDERNAAISDSKPEDLRQPVRTAGYQPTPVEESKPVREDEVPTDLRATTGKRGVI